MKKFCVLFVGIVILVIVGISAYGTEEKPVESELGSYYEEAVDQENSETDVVMAVYKEKTVMKSVVEYQRKAQVSPRLTAVCPNCQTSTAAKSLLR